MNDSYGIDACNSALARIPRRELPARLGLRDDLGSTPGPLALAIGTVGLGGPENLMRRQRQVTDSSAKFGAEHLGGAGGALPRAILLWPFRPVFGPDNFES